MYNTVRSIDCVNLSCGKSVEKKFYQRGNTPGGNAGRLIMKCNGIGNTTLGKK